LKKNQFYISQNALKFTCSNIEFQKKICRGNTPGPPFKGKGRDRKGEMEGGKRKGEGKGRDMGRGGKGKRMGIAHPQFSA